MPESFTVEVQALRRIAIPKINYELLGLKQGDKVRVTVEKVEQMSLPQNDAEHICINCGVVFPN